MSVLKTSWRRSLAATAVAALLVTIPGDAISQEEGDEARVALADEESPEARADREVRERERGDRPGSEREFLMHQVEALKLALHALREAERGDAIELVERAIRAAEVTLEGRRDDEAHMIRERAPNPGQLAEILGMAANLWKEFDNPDKAEAVARLAKELAAPRDREPERPARDRERAARKLVERKRAERERDRHRAEAVAGLERERDELSEKAHRIEIEIGELRDDQDEEARELHGALRETREQIEGVERELAEVTRERQERDRDVAHRERESAERQREMAQRRREEVARRIDELKEASERAREAGRHEEAERIAREAEEIRRDFERRPDAPRPDAPHPEEREELERRANHVRVAIENLHAAGLHEQAEQLARQMEQLLDGRAERRRPRPRDVDAPPREGPPHPEQLEGVLRELHGAIGQLNERMDEMAHRMEREIGEIRHQMENMGREVEETTDQFRERSEDLKREIKELESDLDELADLDEDDDDDEAEDDDDDEGEDDDDEEDEEDDEGEE